MNPAATACQNVLELGLASQGELPEPAKSLFRQGRPAAAGSQISLVGRGWAGGAPTSFSHEYLS